VPGERSAALAILLVIFFSEAQVPQARGQAPSQPISARDLDHSIASAAEALSTLLRADGSFVYEARLDGRSIKSPYNLVRHAGTIYALNMFESRSLSPATKWDIESALDFLKRNVRDALKGTPAASAVVTMSRDDGDTVLGATALAVVAFTTAASRKQSEQDKLLIAQMGRFLLSMQKPDGAFFSRYNFNSALRDDSFQSLYYPGEAALALVNLYAWDPSPDRVIWADAARRALLHLADIRARDGEYPPDNWALIATSALLDAGVPVTEQERATLIAHGEGIAETDLRFQAEDPVLVGALTDSGSPVQTSTRLEGLLAALTFIKSPRLIEATKPVIKKAIAFLIRSQIKEGSFRGAFPETMIVDRPRQRHLFVRIDYIQHALSALILARDRGLFGE
jgi:hypothetical protein